MIYIRHGIITDGIFIMFIDYIFQNVNPEKKTSIIGDVGHKWVHRDSYWIVLK